METSANAIGESLPAATTEPRTFAPSPLWAMAASIVKHISAAAITSTMTSPTRGSRCKGRLFEVSCDIAFMTT